MKTYDRFSEDIESRRQELAQRSQDQISKFKEKSAGVAQAAAERNKKVQDAAKKKAAAAQKAREDAKAAKDAQRQRKDDI